MTDLVFEVLASYIVRTCVELRRLASPVWNKFVSFV